MKNKFGFILVKPQIGENIGACARSLKNFGFSELRIVSPKQSWPNNKAKATSVGMRSLASPDLVSKAMSTLRGRARVKRAMWSRRAQEYEQKINSGDLIAIAEVVRDLYKKEDQGEQSYSERQMYQAALERLAGEFAAVQNVDKSDAATKLEKIIDDSAEEAA